jgi:hypothetical protein
MGIVDFRARAAARRWATLSLAVALALVPAAALPRDDSVELGARVGGGDGIHTQAAYLRWPSEFVRERLVEPYLPDGTQAYWDFTIEHWSRTSESLNMIAFGPVFAFPLSAGSPQLSLGLQPSLVAGESRFHDAVGGSVQFTSHVGLRWPLTSRLWLGLRIQHTSNGGIEEPNPGVDGAKIALGYSF